MAQRKFEYSDGKSFKFWNVERKGLKVVTNYGRIGTKGQETVKEFASEDKAIAGEQKLIDQKTQEGLRGVGRRRLGERGGGGAGDSDDASSISSPEPPASSGRSSGKATRLKSPTARSERTDASQTKEFKTKAAAQKAYDKLVEEKTARATLRSVATAPQAEAMAAAFSPRSCSTPRRTETTSARCPRSSENGR